MSQAVLERFGQVDVLVNSAGINVPARSFAALSLDDWHAVINTNLHGAYYCVRAFLPGMRGRAAGRSSTSTPTSARSHAIWRARPTSRRSSA